MTKHIMIYCIDSSGTWLRSQTKCCYLFLTEISTSKNFDSGNSEINQVFILISKRYIPYFLEHSYSYRTWGTVTDIFYGQLDIHIKYWISFLHSELQNTQYPKTIQCFLAVKLHWRNFITELTFFANYSQIISKVSTFNWQ